MPLFIENIFLVTFVLA